MTTTAPNLADEFRAAGLAARRRDLPRIAYVWTMSNGTLARPLGRCAWLLVPFSGTLQLIGAAALLPVLVRRANAAAVVKPPSGKYRLDRAALAAGLAIFVLAWSIYAILLYLLLATATRLFISFELLLIVSAIDLAGSATRSRTLQHQQRVPGLTKTAEAVGAASISCVAAYPRGGGRGRELMEAVNSVLDDHALTALLDARPPAAGSRFLPESRRPDLMAWYHSLGYRATGTWRRMARQPGTDTAD